MQRYGYFSKNDIRRMKKCRAHLEKDGSAFFLREGLQLLVGFKRWNRLEWGLAFFLVSYLFAFLFYAPLEKTAGMGFWLF